ncbi:MAG: glycoside hydrolase family 32 protein [Armatimonadetes bacterium]|nr:glycoside hydrolase family 32 protein [Armatimonadota bacterium]
MRHIRIGVLLAATLFAGTAIAGRRDIVIADFNGLDYGNWSAAGTAFGTGPARGTLPNQMPVSGYEGRGLVNSYHGGDAATGTLTSPEFRVARRYLHLRVGGGQHPGRTGAHLLIDGRIIRSATGSNDERLEWRTWDVSDLAGRKARIQIVDRSTEGWGHINVDEIVQSDRRRGESTEPSPTPQWRPQYHYTPAQNFMNDPNGLVYHRGEWHAFHQYNPFGNRWGHMSWYHAVSRNLVRWEEWGVALQEEDGVQIFSGSAVVDERNTSGFGKNGQPPLVALYTGHRAADNMQSQNLAYSTDRGRTWTKYEGNPVVGWEKDVRDPKVFWHAPTRKWVMAVVKADQKAVRFYGSKDLKEWALLSTFGPEGVPVAQKANWECPDLFPLPIEGEPGKSRWVLHVGMSAGHKNGGSGGEYFIGDFDGTTFHNDNPPDTVLWEDYGKDNYAAISWDNITGPRGERFWVGWMSNWQYANEVPTYPWRNGFTLPRLLSLRRLPEGLRLISLPAPQLTALRGISHRYDAREVTPTNPFVPGRQAWGDALEIEAEFEIGSAREFGIAVRKGEPEETLVGYDSQKGEIFVDRTRSGRNDFSPHFAGRHGGPLPIRDGRMKMRVFVDRNSVEVFGNDGEAVVTDLIFPKLESQGIQVYAKGGAARLVSMRVWKMKTARSR